MFEIGVIDQAWKTVLKFAGIICINSFFCLMLLLVAGIHNWTIGVVFLISLASCVSITIQFYKIKLYAPAYRQFVITVSMFTIILFFMALIVKRFTDNEFENLLLYGTLPIMVNFMIVLPIWFYDKYKEARLEYKKRQEEVQRANEGLMSGMK
jgi:uncharacterized membrane protein YhaH (DUF805 family)